MVRKTTCLAIAALLLGLLASPAQARTRVFHYSAGSYSTSYLTLEKIVVSNRQRAIRINIVGSFFWSYVDQFEVEVHTPRTRRSWTLRSRTPHRLGPQKTRFFKSVYRVGLVKKACTGGSIKVRRDGSGAVARLPQRCFGRHTPKRLAGSVWLGDNASKVWPRFGFVRRG